MPLDSRIYNASLNTSTNSISDSPNSSSHTLARPAVIPASDSNTSLSSRSFTGGVPTTSLFKTSTPSDESVNAFKDGWLNRHSSSLSSSYSWKLCRAVLKDGILMICKPPSDIGIKAFDISISPSANLAPTSSQTVVNSSHHKRIMSSSTLVPHSSISFPPKSSAASAYHISHKSLAPHPELIYNDAGKIVGGSDEAVCHTILYGPSDAFAETSIQLLPLLTEICSAFDLLAEYAGCAPRTSSPVPRLRLVVETVQTKFPGMLLDTQIFSSLLRLIECISIHDDTVATHLKMSVFKKQRQMTDLLSYGDQQDQPTLWSLQPRVADQMSDRLHSFLNNIEAAAAATGNNNIHHHTPRNILIPPDLILELSIETLSQQIYFFHLNFSREWSPTSDMSLLFTTKYNYYRHSPLVFDSTNVHFLGALLLDHLFNPNHSTSPELRGKILTYWINLGNALKNYGDMVGWLAIATVICSISVLRLKNSWAHVSSDVKERVVKEWAPVVFDLERRLMISDMSRKSTYHVLAPQGIGLSYPKERVVPFFGDLCVRFEEGSSYRQCEGRLTRIRTAFDRWEVYMSQISQDDTFDPAPDPVPSLQKLLYSLLAYHYESPVMTPESVLQMSLVTEPAATGEYLRYHYSQRSPLTNGSYLPLIFTPVTQSYQLFASAVLIAASGVQNNPKRSGLIGSRVPNSDHSEHPSNHGRFGGNPPVTGGPTLQRSMSFPPSGHSVALTTGYSEIDSSSRQFVTKYASRHILMRNIRDVLNVGARLYHIGDDIVLKSFDEDSSKSSRPSSVIENPSKRLSNHSNSRRVSAQFTNGSPRVVGSVPDYISLSNAFDKSGNLGSVVNVVVKAANLERLVDILVLGVREFGDFVKKDDLLDPVVRSSGLPDTSASSTLPTASTVSPQFKIDMDAHTLTFFATFRSFCSPQVLLDSLHRRFIGARSAAVSIRQIRESAFAAVQNIDAQNSPFTAEGWSKIPNWEPECDASIEQIDWRIVAQIQIGVLEACHLWISQYFTDFVNSLTTRNKFLELLRVFETEIVRWKDPVSFRDDNAVYLESIEALHRRVRKLFIKKSYRPIEVTNLVPSYPVGSHMENLPVNGDLLQVEKFVDDIDRVISEHFNAVQLKDWMELFEVLELQSTDIGGFFNYKSPTSNEDDVVIQNIFSYLDGLQRVDRNGSSASSSIIAAFPTAVQDLFRLHLRIVSYLTYQICQPSLKRDERIARTTTVLKTLGIVKRRMTNLELFPGDSNTAPYSDRHWGTNAAVHNGGVASVSPRVPSFFESAICEAILRPESRAFANTWIQASKEVCRTYGGSLNGALSSLDLAIPDIPYSLLKSESSSRALTPCAGWLIERMLEIVCYVPNMSVENSRLINFDKRRYVYNLVVNISELKTESESSSLPISSSTTAGESKSRRYAFLVHPVKNLFHLDRRAVRDAASREIREYPKSGAKNRVFTLHVSAEVEKIKRDSRQREPIERQSREIRKVHNNHQSSSSSGIAGNIPRPAAFGGGNPSNASMAEKKSSKTRFGGLLKAVRPISMAFTSSFTAQTDKIVSPYELPEISSLGDVKCKVQASINLADADISPVHQRSGVPGNADFNNFVFKVVSDHGTEYIFQAPNPGEAEDWIRAVINGKKYAIHASHTLPTSTKVFGVPIRIICEREGSSIPRIVDTLIQEIEARGLDEIGLYRIPGSLASVTALKAAFDSGDTVNMEDDRWFDINTVTGCFKLYLRDLPEPLLTKELFAEFVACGTGQESGLGSGSDTSRLVLLRACVAKLPSPNYELLKRLVEHLAIVTEHRENNRMHAVNLSIVFSMSFLPHSYSASSVSTDLGAMQTILKLMILHHEQIFGEDEFADELTLDEEGLVEGRSTQQEQSSIQNFEDESVIVEDEDNDATVVLESSREETGLAVSSLHQEMPGREEISESPPSEIPSAIPSRRIDKKRFSMMALPGEIPMFGMSSSAPIPTSPIAAMDASHKKSTNNGSTTLSPQAELEELDVEDDNDISSNRDSLTEVSAY